MNNFHVSLVKELCPVCCKEIDGPIIMNRVLTEKAAEEVKNLEGKVIGFADHCCEECAKYKDKVVFFVGIDISKSSVDSLKNMYRTGQIIGIKKEADIIKQFEKYIISLKDDTKIIFIDEKVGNEIGIFNNNQNE